MTLSVSAFIAEGYGVHGISVAARVFARTQRVREGGHVAKEDRGFASMDRGKQREIASKGGLAAHQKGTAHEWTSEEARDAGRKVRIASHRRMQEQTQPQGSEDSNAGRPRSDEMRGRDEMP